MGLYIYIHIFKSTCRCIFTCGSWNVEYVCNKYIICTMHHVLYHYAYINLCVYIYIACKYTCTHLPHMLGQTSRWQQGAFATYAGYIRISARGTVWAYVHVFMLPCWSYQNLCIYVCFNFYVCVLACSPPRTARLNIPHSKSGMLGQQVWQQSCFKISGPKLHGFPTETRHFIETSPDVPTRCQRLQDLA